MRRNVKTNTGAGVTGNRYPNGSLERERLGTTGDDTGLGEFPIWNLRSNELDGTQGLHRYGYAGYRHIELVFH